MSKEQQSEKKKKKAAYGNYFWGKQALSHSSVHTEYREHAGGPLHQLWHGGKLP